MKKVENVEKLNKKEAIIYGSVASAAALILAGGAINYNIQAKQEKDKEYDLIDLLTNDSYYAELAAYNCTPSGVKTSKGSVGAEVFDDVSLVRFSLINIKDKEGFSTDEWVYPSDTILEYDGQIATARKIVDTKVITSLLDAGYEFNIVFREGNFMDSAEVVTAEEHQLKNEDGSTKIAYSIPYYCITTEEYNKNLTKTLK